MMRSRGSERSVDVYGGRSSASPADVEDTVPDSAGTISFADSHLEAAIRQALENPATVLQQSDLLSLTDLEAGSRRIKGLAGLERLQNLRVLDLSDNQLRDISVLSSLTNLTFLDLGNNQIQDISPLASLAHLDILALDSNEIEDIAPLLELVELSSLELTDNPLDEASLKCHLPALQNREVAVTHLRDQGQGGPHPPAGWTSSFCSWARAAMPILTSSG